MATYYQSFHNSTNNTLISCELIIADMDKSSKLLLAENLRALMDGHPLLNTQQALAKRSGVAQGTISHMLVASTFFFMTQRNIKVLLDRSINVLIKFSHRTNFKCDMKQKKLSGPNGESKTKHELFRTWSSMVQRCTNPNVHCFKSYGGKGVRVCERWMIFWNFVQDMHPRPSKKHSIDRIDTNGNYEPGNVRWATQKEQLRNQSRNVRITFGGTEKCVSEWAEDTGLSKEVIFSRLRKLGWSIEKTLTTPARKRSFTA